MQLKLKPYNPNFLDVSVLWTTGPDFGDGFRSIHRLDNISLNFDACYRARKENNKPAISHRIRKFMMEGYEVQDDFGDNDDDVGEVYDGSKIGLSTWYVWIEGNNLKWKILPWCKCPCPAHVISSCLLLPLIFFHEFLFPL